jgi:hypothetical protein
MLTAKTSTRPAEKRNTGQENRLEVHSAQPENISPCHFIF